MQMKILYFSLIPILLLAAGSANSAIFNRDSCTVQHAQSAKPPEVTKTTLDDTLNWDFSRAEYLRELDYQNLNTHYPYPKAVNYQEKSDLIESKYHLALAEAEVSESNNMINGQPELKVAQCYVNKALTNAGKKDVPQLKNVKNGLTKIANSPQHHLFYFDDKQAALTKFHKVENEVGSLL